VEVNLCLARFFTPWVEGGRELSPPEGKEEKGVALLSFGAVAKRIFLEEKKGSIFGGGRVELFWLGTSIAGHRDMAFLKKGRL